MKFQSTSHCMGRRGPSFTWEALAYGVRQSESDEPRAVRPTPRGVRDEIGTCNAERQV